MRALSIVHQADAGPGVFADVVRESGWELETWMPPAAAPPPIDGRYGAALAGRSEAYRRLDAAILEALLLRGALGMSDEDLDAKRGISYAASRDAALAALENGGAAAFLLRPTPVEQVREVAAAGETMPPKSTYFFPKLLTGLVFNPLS